MLPLLLLSKLTRGVNGRPDCAEKIALTCQSRVNAASMSEPDFAGTSQVVVNTRR